jgi:hypothetical protein
MPPRWYMPLRQEECKICHVSQIGNPIWGNSRSVIDVEKGEKEKEISTNLRLMSMIMPNSCKRPLNQSHKSCLVQFRYLSEVMPKTCLSDSQY